MSKLNTRIERLEEAAQSKGGECAREAWKNIRIILPDDDSGDAPPNTDERCGVCGGERQIIRVVYVESPCDLEEASA
jgi:hypothetical protein